MRLTLKGVLMGAGTDAVSPYPGCPPVTSYRTLCWKLECVMWFHLKLEPVLRGVIKLYFWRGPFWKPSFRKEEVRLPVWPQLTLVSGKKRGVNSSAQGQRPTAELHTPASKGQANYSSPVVGSNLGHHELLHPLENSF